MKNLTIALGLIIALNFYSCGGDNSKQEKNAAEKTGAAKTVTFSNDYLTIDLPGDWIVNEYGANNNEGFSIFSFKAGNSGKDLREAFIADHEVIGEVSETTVDGLPAVTRKQRFKQNEVKLSRAWIIDDGKNLISFNVAAPENIYDDKKADELIEKVVIKNHYVKDDNDKNTDDSMSKPASFPQKTIHKISDNLSQNQVLSDNTIETSIKALSALQNFSEQVDDNRKAAVIDSITKANGIEDFNRLTTVVLPTAYTSMAVLKLMEKAESPDNELESKMTMDIIKGLVSQSKLSAADLKYTYNNWNKVLELTKFQKKD